ncbi:uncharacterized protein RCC_10839 [Ramularia collo-cygni]|uniref:Uncharacterized protein n=1 Tax=Ramularia collo-cygni TaxID=112498 RepID=A0A2D3VDF0_9PEZI|nr:uncharacterized protein RCC_10839 [Ramularia collo-cygni]CZT25110.1 uncharacterized protein RCC_10839 [Ramularia collo-cygni]
MTDNADPSLNASQEDHTSALLQRQSEALCRFLSDPSISASEAAQNLTAPTLGAQRKAKSNHETLSDGSKLWKDIANAIRNQTDQNDRLVELVREIQKISDDDDTFKSMAGYHMYWTEFAYDFKVPRSDDADREAQMQGWVNMNAFCAKLSRSRVPALDERSRSAWVIKEALEKTPWEQTSHADLEEMLEDDPDDEVVAEEVAYEYEIRKITVLEYWIPAAAAWMKNDSRGIYEMEGKISIADDEGWYPSNWTGRRGWSKDRFAFWKDRFRTISDIEELSESTRREAVDAAECMEAVMRGSTS